MPPLRRAGYDALRQLTELIEQDGSEFIALRSPDTAEDDPDYRELGRFPTREKAEEFLASVRHSGMRHHLAQARNPYSPSGYGFPDVQLHIRAHRFAMLRNDDKKAPDGQITGAVCRLPVQPLSQKYSGFPKPQITLISRMSCPTEGRLEIVTDAGQDAVDADALLTNGA
jgi:hypothetical protein